MALINLNDLSISGWNGNYADYDGSTKIRMISILGSLRYLIKRPLFGLSLGSTYAHSTMATVLASTGIVGAVSWWLFTFKSDRNAKGAGYNLVSIIWILFLIILDNGLFPFYGIENIIIVYIDKNFLKQSSMDKRHEIVN